MAKNMIIETLSLEENNLSNYVFDRDRPDLNAVIHVKEDLENPIIRLDAVVDQSARQIFNTLQGTNQISQWFGERCLLSRMVESQPSGSEVFVMVLQFPPPANQIVIYYKRFLKYSDQQSSAYKLMYSSKGLENYQPPANFCKQVLSETKIKLSGSEAGQRASFAQFGIVLRQSQSEPPKGSKQAPKALTKVFYLQQMDFGGYIMPNQ